MQKEDAKKTSSLAILSVLVGALVLLNVLFMMLIRNEAHTSKLLKAELVSLEQNAQIIASSQEIYNTYKDNIDVISSVFPTEETIPDFIQTMEEQIRISADEYTLKFNSVTPLVEQEKLYLPFTVNIKTDLPRLIQLLTNLEKLHYMTHITGILAKSPTGIMQNSEYTLSMKVYVQNPFSN